MTTKSGTYSKDQTLSGFIQRIINPSNPASNVLSVYASTTLSVVIPIAFGQLTYLSYLPDGAFIKQISVVLANNSFSAGSVLNVGSTLAGSDLVNSLDITKPSISILASPVLASTLFRNATQPVRPFYLTLGGTPTSGVGFVVVDYLNA